MHESLEAWLARLFGGEDARSVLAAATAGSARDTSEGAPTPQLTSAQRELLRSALQHYERARAAQRTDDWATYGAEMRQLGELLQKLNEP
jgi:uncharacterized membrane protein (UPF0182 family)